jgi:hypothetical protein
MSRNQLSLSLSKRIRHGFVAKINGKRRSRIYEALDQISADYSRARRAPVPITSPRHARPNEVRRASACVFLSSLIYTLASAQRESHLLNRPPSTSISKIGRKSCHSPCMNRHLKFIRNFLLVWSNNSNMLQARDEDRTRQFTYDRSLLATHVDQWWWKTHFSAVNWGDGTNSLECHVLAWATLRGYDGLCTQRFSGRDSNVVHYVGDTRLYL